MDSFINTHNEHHKRSMQGCKLFGFMTKGDANEKDDLQENIIN